jgi:hypothetical protein
MWGRWMALVTFLLGSFIAKMYIRNDLHERYDLEIELILIPAFLTGGEIYALSQKCEVERVHHCSSFWTCTEKICHTGESGYWAGFRPHNGSHCQYDQRVSDINFTGNALILHQSFLTRYLITSIVIALCLVIWLVILLESLAINANKEVNNRLKIVTLVLVTVLTLAAVGMLFSLAYPYEDLMNYLTRLYSPPEFFDWTRKDYLRTYNYFLATNLVSDFTIILLAIVGLYSKDELEGELRPLILNQ